MDEVLNFMLEESDEDSNKDIDLGYSDFSNDEDNNLIEFEVENIMTSTNIQRKVKNTIKNINNVDKLEAAVPFSNSILPLFNDTDSESSAASSTSDSEIETFVTYKKSPRTRGGGTRRVRVRGGIGIKCNKVISVESVTDSMHITHREAITDDAAFNVNILNNGVQGSIHNHRRGRVCSRGKGRNRSQKPPLSTWGKVNTDVLVNLMDFSELFQEGLNVRMGQNPTSLDFFELYFPVELVTLLVEETNWYARQFFAANPDNSSIWEETNVAEIKTFIAVILLMGIIYKPKLSMYWSKDELYNTPIFSEIINPNRFSMLLKFFHFNNNEDENYDETDDNRDRLYKVRPVINILRNRFKTVYNPGKNLSVDESLVLYKGHLHFRQYIKTKRARFGIKLYELATSEGITLDFLVYCGKGMFADDDINDQMPSSARIPSVLMEPFIGKGHTLYTDNYYTCTTLAKYFLDNKTHLCGTIRSNRFNYSKDILIEVLKKGDAVFYKNNDANSQMLACKFRASKDKASGKQKVVYMLSTCHQPFMRIIKNTRGLNIQKPICVKEYNSHMGGVDRVDQQLQSLNLLRKTYKWYRKLAFRLISQGILNSHKIFVKYTCHKSTTFLDFLHDTIKLTFLSSPKLNKTLVPDDTIHRLTGRHFPGTKQPSHDATDRRPSKLCRVCYARGIFNNNGKPLKTVHVCKTCPGEPGLHIDSCFEIYHTVLDLV
ncbi:piggyBac transposable element-derived protein 4-like [Hydra vulgaris]|uniref:PiggyBac transposable element-derived protein 4-like n=1 Tax=Hydra vulgaris TaxID=6087 RepID=A0ABM4BX95_HYDVU